MDVDQEFSKNWLKNLKYFIKKEKFSVLLVYVSLEERTV